MIQFSGVDIVVDRGLSADEVRHCLAVVLSVEPARVSVIGDVSEYPESSTADVVCVQTPTSGEFAEVLSIQSDAIDVPLASIMELVQRISSMLGVVVLGPDDGLDPYVMWLVRPHRDPMRVSLDEASFEQERYKIRGGEGM